MTLTPDMSIQDKRRITKAYPVLICAPVGAGKTRSMEQLAPEDKKRTVYICLDNKDLLDSFEDEYRTVVYPKPEGIIPPERAKLYVDYDNIKFKTLSELELYLRAAMEHPEVDRIVIDSVTKMNEELETKLVTTTKGFTTWSEYGKAIMEWVKLFKEEQRYSGKLVYVFAHYTPAKNSSDSADAERFVQTKGNIWKRGDYEGHFNTVVEIQDHKFIADNEDNWSSTRIHGSLSPYESEENSLPELEDALTSLYYKKEQ